MNIRAHAPRGWTREPDVVFGVWIDGVRVKDAGVTPLLGRRCFETVPHADIESKCGRNLPVVLNVKAMLPGSRQRSLQPLGKRSCRDRAGEEARKGVPGVRGGDTIGIQPNVVVQGEGAA